MLFNLPFEILIFLIPALILSLCVHEYAHALIAYSLGDDTAYKDGRLTLNPLKHLDPFGTFLLFIAGFGYAKPVPVNTLNLNDPRKDMVKVAAAGPISNFILAGIACVCCKFFIFTDSMLIFLWFFFQINILLGVFNLLPIFPLDGGQIFNNTMYKKYPEAVDFLQKNGMYILLGSIIFGRITNIHVISMISTPIQYAFAYFFNVPAFLSILSY